MLNWLRLTAMIVGAMSIMASAACSSDDGGESDPTTTAGTPTASATDDIDARIDAILADGGPSFGEFNRDQLRTMMTVEEDAPFYMVNFIKFREFAAYPDGSDATLTGREANDRYNVLPILLEIGARPVFVANVEQQLLGDDTKWDQVAVVLYPSREAFVSMLERPDFQKVSVHKDAGVEKSLVLVASAGELPVLPPVDEATLPFPATAEDTAFTMVHLMQFNERATYADGRETDLTGREAIRRYEQAAGQAAFPLGVRPTAVLEVEAVLVGDGRNWDEVRFNRFPSHAAFRTLTTDQSWQSHQPDRAAALADTYALITLPIVDSIAKR